MVSMELRTSGIVAAGCFGVLWLPNRPIAVTLERTFEREHEQVVIPGGTHRCIASHYHRGGYDTYEIMVPGHSRVLFHKGNVETNSEGCVLLGSSFGLLNGVPAVLASGPAFDNFMHIMDGVQEFDLVVTGR